jgi:hypothetical protein
MRSQIASAGHARHAHRSLRSVLRRRRPGAANKGSVVMFAAGAIAAWTIAHRKSRDGQMSAAASAAGDPSLSSYDDPARFAPARRRVDTLTDPFSGAFRVARAEVNSHSARP